MKYDSDWTRRAKRMPHAMSDQQEMVGIASTAEHGDGTWHYSHKRSAWRGKDPIAGDYEVLRGDFRFPEVLQRTMINSPMAVSMAVAGSGMGRCWSNSQGNRDSPAGAK